MPLWCGPKATSLMLVQVYVAGEGGTDLSVVRRVKGRYKASRPAPSM